MKARRVLSGLLFGLGCATVFIGVIATVLPMIPNDQLRLVLSSFEMPSENIIVSGINAMMTYALRNCYLVMLLGVAEALFGALLLLSMREERRVERRETSRAQSRAGGGETPWPTRARELARAQQGRVQRTDPLAAAPIANADNPFAAYAPPAPAAAKRLERPVIDVSAFVPPADWIRPELPQNEQTTEEKAPITAAKPAADEAQTAQVAQPAPAAPHIPAQAPAQASSVAPTPIESRALPELSTVAEAGAKSQSGSRLIIRSTFEKHEKPPEVEAQPPAESIPAVEESPKSVVEPQAEPAQSNDAPQASTPDACKPEPPVSTRIRSTMGRHS